MLGINKVIVADNERVMVYKNKNLHTILTAGKHWVFSGLDAIVLKRYEITEIIFEEENTEYLMAQYGNLLAEHLEPINTSEREVALLYVDNKLTQVVSPASYLMFWKNCRDVRVEKYDLLLDEQVPAKVINLMKGNGDKSLVRQLQEAVFLVTVASQEKAVLIIDGKVTEILSTGTYGYWRYNQNVQAKMVDMKLLSMDVAGQEVLTNDRVSIRVNVTANYQVVDVVQMTAKVKDPVEFVYKTVQLALREAIGVRSLDEILANKNSLNKTIEAGVDEMVKAYGVSLKQLGVKDIILPGEMKDILNQVVQAQKAAEANLIKRREETAATRSLYNTAKMMENNQTLLRLKELETLEKVTHKIDKISVYGGLDGVLNGLVSIPVDKT